MYMQILIAFITVLSWFCVLVMSFLNPSDTLPMSEIGFLAWSLAVLFLPAGITVCITRLFKQKTAVHFFCWYGASFCFVFAAIFWGAYWIHRDFYSLLFLYVIIFFILIMIRLPYLKLIRNKKRVYTAIRAAAWGIFFTFSIWLIFMGYAIVTRSEPRWIESIAYNFLAMIILGILVASISILGEQINRVFMLSGKDILLDDRNLGDYFTGKEKEILESFARAPEHQLNCSELLGGQIDTCRQCLDEGWTATHCKGYRNLKNQITLVKKYLELLEIGTLVTVSDNYRENKRRGWKLRFFDDVVLKINH
ncbi:hypothetical protein [Spirochaeta dissipatitropha]